MLRLEGSRGLVSEVAGHVVEEDLALAHCMDAVLGQAGIVRKRDAIAGAKDGRVAERLQGAPNLQETAGVEGQAAVAEQGGGRCLRRPQDGVKWHTRAVFQKQGALFAARDPGV